MRRFSITLLTSFLLIIGFYTGLKIVTANVDPSDYSTSIATDIPGNEETATAIVETNIVRATEFAQARTATALANLYPDLEEIRAQEYLMMLTGAGPDVFNAYDVTSTALAITYAGTPVPTPTLYASAVSFSACAWSWATQPLPQHSRLLDLGLALLPSLRDTFVSVSAFAFGENCNGQNGEVARFAAMQTDFTINLRYNDLPTNEDALLTLIGETTFDILNVLTIPIFAPGQTPGPNPGRIIIRFTVDDDDDTHYSLTITWRDAMSALEANLRGEAMVEALGGLR